MTDKTLLTTTAKERKKARAFGAEAPVPKHDAKEIRAEFWYCPRCGRSASGMRDAWLSYQAHQTLVHGKELLAERAADLAWLRHVGGSVS